MVVVMSKYIISLGSASALIGAWFWQKENAYASLTGNELASTLQWVGVSQVLVGVAVVLIGLEMRGKK
jgi:hypothetical protein